MLRVVFRVAMYEERILEVLQAARGPLSIAEVKGALERRLGGKVSYETVKRDLITLSAKGVIQSKAVGRGKRVAWIFWALGREQTPKPPQTKRAKALGISIGERDSMSPKELSALYDEVIEEHASLIKGKLGGRSRYIVLCDGKVVYASSREPKDEEIRSLERKLGKVCYVLTEDPVEESRWSPASEGDYYPTVDLHVGNAG